MQTTLCVHVSLGFQAFLRPLDEALGRKLYRVGGNWLSLQLLHFTYRVRRAVSFLYFQRNQTLVLWEKQEKIVVIAVADVAVYLQQRLAKLEYPSSHSIKSTLIDNFQCSLVFCFQWPLVYLSSFCSTSWAPFCSEHRAWQLQVTYSAVLFGLGTSKNR